MIKKFKENKPSIKFSSDFIIAYPGETEKDFEETLNLMTEVKFINSYSFIYSARPGTPAADLKEIDKITAKKRLKKFQELSDKIKKNYRKNLLNSEINVLFENKVTSQNEYFGRDEYFNSVIVKSNENLIGKIKKVKINNYNQNTLFGIVKTNFREKEFAA